MAVTSHAVLPVGPLAAGLTVVASARSHRPWSGRVVTRTAMVWCRGSRHGVAQSSADRQPPSRALLRLRRASARAELLPLIDHQLRTPLTTVVGHTEMLLSCDAGELNRDQERMLVAVEAGGARLVELIEAVAQVAHECLTSEQSLDLADVVQRLGDLDAHLG